MTQYTIDGLITAANVSAKDIDAVNTGTKTFTISDEGDLTTNFPAGRWFEVSGSTGNDGFYDVVSTAYSAPDFDIVVRQAIPDATADGSITTYHSFNISGDGDLTTTFYDGKIIHVHNSTGNDGAYTVINTDFNTPDFDVVVSETIADTTVDGTIGDFIIVINDPG
jgi:hypothetical protein